MTRKYTHMTNNLQCTVIAFTVLSEKKKKNNSSLNQIIRIRSPVLGSVLGVLNLDMLLSGCVIVGKLLNIFVSQFPHL